jgi:hypothetical protein
VIPAEIKVAADIAAPLEMIKTEQQVLFVVGDPVKAFAQFGVTRSIRQICLTEVKLMDA